MCRLQHGCTSCWFWSHRLQFKLELSGDLTIAPLQHYQSFLAFIVPEKSVINTFKNGKIWKPTKGHNSKSYWPLATNFATTPLYLRDQVWYNPANTQRRCTVMTFLMTLQRRWNDIVATLCVCLEVSSKKDHKQKLLSKMHFKFLKTYQGT